MRHLVTPSIAHCLFLPECGGSFAAPQRNNCYPAL